MGGIKLGYQDSSAALLEDGKLVAFVEEERLNRVKHSPGVLPERAIGYVLESQHISINDVDYAVSHGSTWQHDHRQVLREFFLSKFGGCPRNIELVHHHDAHCASTYFASGFNDALILTADASGDATSTQFAIGFNKKIQAIERIERPNSLGFFYLLLTEYCGFLKDEDEFKVMGLAAYGDRNRYDLSWLLTFKDGHYQINPHYLKQFKSGEAGPHKQVPIYTDALTQKLGPPRRPGSPMTKHFQDVAASGQKLLEEVLVHLITDFHSRTGLRKLCLAGGIALNVTANQRLMNLPFIDDIYIQPAANDAGISLGAAYWVASQLGEDIAPLPHVYYGPEYSDKDIESALRLANVNYFRVDDVAAYAAHKVASNKIVGWFQGRMEFGPRALGNRSILANPTIKGMRDIVNSKIKFREEFRPFCPSVIEEDAQEYFIGKSMTSPYMTIAYDVKKEQIARIPSVTHVDNTARIQTVNKDQNVSFYNYLQELKKLIGLGLTLNTSFNVKGEPIVNTPFNAMATFYGSGMDTLIIGNFVINKG